MTEDRNGTVVTVSGEGRVTIPEEVRDKLQIDAPGRIRFTENDGEIVVRAVKRPSELRGALKPEDTDQELSATELLREERQPDRSQ